MLFSVQSNVISNVISAARYVASAVTPPTRPPAPAAPVGRALPGRLAVFLICMLLQLGAAEVTGGAHASSADFGSIYPASLGTSSNSWTWGPITNPNSLTVQIVVGLTSNPDNAFAIVSGAGTTNLAYNQSMNVKVTFSNAGQAAGTKTGQLKILWQQTNGTPIGQPSYYDLTGYVAQAPSLGGQALSLQSFLNQPSTGTARVTNNGTLPLTLSSKTLSAGSHFQFASAADSDIAVIPAGGFHDLQLTYLADAHGTQTGYLSAVITYDGLSYNRVINGQTFSYTPVNLLALQGKTVYSADFTGSTTFDAGTTYFGKQVSGTVQVKNAGGQTLTINQATLTGPDVARFQITGGNQAGTVAAFGSRDISLRYLGDSIGSHTAALHLSYSYDGVAGTRDFALAGQTVWDPNQKFAVHLTVSGSGSGSVASTPAGLACNANCSASFAAGSDVSLHPAAAPYSLFGGWTLGDCSGTGDCPLAMVSDKSLTASFEKDLEHRVSTGNPRSYYATLQAGYAAAPDGSVIETWAVPFDENLVCDQSVGVAFRGGYDSDYVNLAGDAVLRGTFFIRDGRVVADGVRIR